jgi:hypothetical protein
MLNEFIFGHDDFLFCKADGLHYEINSCQAVSTRKRMKTTSNNENAHRREFGLRACA